MHFSCGKSNVKVKSHSEQPCTAFMLQNEVHLSQLIHINQPITTGELCKKAEKLLQHPGSHGGNIGISQSLHQACPMNAHTGIEGTPNAAFSGLIEPVQG